MGKTIAPIKKTRQVNADKQSRSARVNRIVNEEADEEIRDEYLKHIVDISNDPRKENN